MYHLYASMAVCVHSYSCHILYGFIYLFKLLAKVYFLNCHNPQMSGLFPHWPQPTNILLDWFCFFEVCVYPVLVSNHGIIFQTCWER